MYDTVPKFYSELLKTNFDEYNNFSDGEKNKKVST